MPNVFGIADDILVIGYDDGTDHDAMVHKMQKVNLKLNKEKCVILGPHPSLSLEKWYQEEEYNQTHKK